LDTEDVDGPAGKTLALLVTLNDLAVLIQDDIVYDDENSFWTHIGAYQTALLNLGVRFAEVKILANDVLGKASTLISNSEGDALRIEGVDALAQTLGDYLGQIQKKVDAAKASTDAVITALLNDGFFSLFFTSANTNFGLMTTNINALNARIGNVTNGAPSATAVGNFDILTTLGLNSMAADIEGYLADVVASVGDAIDTAEAMYDEGETMTEDYDNANTTSYTTAKRHYLNGWPTNTTPTEGLGQLAGIVNPDGATFPDGTNYGQIGGVFENVESTQAAVADVTNEVDDVSFGYGLADKLRYKGIDSYLNRLGNQLVKLGNVIAGSNNATDTPLQRDGLNKQLADLLTDMGATTAGLLLPQGPPVIALFGFIIDGGGPVGEPHINGINDYLDEITDARGFLFI